MWLETDPANDTAYVTLSIGRYVARSREIDSLRIADYDADGQMVGIEFLAISRGVDLTGLPRADELARLFEP